MNDHVLLNCLMCYGLKALFCSTSVPYSVPEVVKEEVKKKKTRRIVSVSGHGGRKSQHGGL